ncbi:outer membrane protein assembly factor BamE [Paenalcaligenes hominis]|uniref:outer membrane protein assembly factor BamE n=1 Tax=Paenalcaligenes hominis TaxID=643674 RepID=UPI003523F52A
MIAKKYSTFLRVGLIAGLSALTLSACSGTKWGFPYKAPVQQGNWLTEAQVNRLSVGMSREQVHFLLGTPTLQDIFHSNRWDYPYYHKPGTGNPELRTFTVWFEGDELVRWDGDPQPNRQPYEQADSGANAITPSDLADEPQANPITNPVLPPADSVLQEEPLR